MSLLLQLVLIVLTILWAYLLVGHETSWLSQANATSGDQRTAQSRLRWATLFVLAATTVFATLVCGYLRHFATGWVLTQEVLLVLSSGVLGAVIVVSLPLTRPFATIHQFARYLIVILVMVQLLVVQPVWLR